MPTMRFATLLLLLLAPFLAVSCGGSSDPKELTDAGNKALGSNDYGTALESFEKALEVIGDDASHAQYLSANLGAVEARGKTDPTGALEALKTLTAAAPGKLTDRDYSRIASSLGVHNHLDQAIEVVRLGMGLFPEAKSLKEQVMALGDKAKAAAAGGDSSALDAIRGLGYGG